MAVFQPCRSAAQDAAAPSNADLAQRISDLEKQLMDLKAQLAEQKSAAAPAPAPAASAAVATTETKPAAPSLASLLGPTTLSGFVDVYYDYNSNQPAGRTTQYRNFDINSSQFALNMLELVADKPVDTTNRAGYHIALGFGQAMNAVNSASPTELGFDQYLKEGYLEYMAPVGKGLQINVGKFVTPAGAEVIESKDNWNYTRGILFAWAIPYFHFGLNAKYAFNSKFSLTGYLVNGWNNSVDNNSGKTTGFSAAYTPNSKFSLVENYLVGPEQANDNSDFRHLTDTVVTYSPNAKLSFIANYDYGHDRALVQVSPHLSTPGWWSGIAGYIKYAPNATWTVATRGEYFKDHDGFSTGTPQDLSEFTFTLQRMLASKIISRLEFRRDMSNQDTFPYRDGLFKDAQNTVTIGLIYAFSSADAK
ncbi:MAG TPA: porin [Terriglobales bacterium]|nr:porin [Terriglobales bacterium]